MEPDERWGTDRWAFGVYRQSRNKIILNKRGCYQTGSTHEITEGVLLSSTLIRVRQSLTHSLRQEIQELAVMQLGPNHFHFSTFSLFRGWSLSSGFPNPTSPCFGRGEASSWSAGPWGDPSLSEGWGTAAIRYRQSVFSLNHLWGKKRIFTSVLCDNGMVGEETEKT